MTGIDTNVLLRFLTEDDPRQTETARRWLEQDCTPENPGFISLVTMVETAWVLQSLYDLAPSEIVAAFEALLQADNLVFQNEAQVLLAISAVDSGEGDFADALIGALGKWAGCETTVTFDRRAARQTSFQLLR